jgi:hypothetical protein
MVSFSQTYIANSAGELIYGMMLTLSRPSGTPESGVHVLLDCPTLDPKTHTHIDSALLDWNNYTGKHLLLKGFQDTDFFAFDTFSRRVKYPKAFPSQKRNPRKIWPNFAKNHDELHSEYRKHGGHVTLIMGKNAWDAYLDVLKREGVEMKLDKAFYEGDGFTVWAELV